MFILKCGIIINNNTVLLCSCVTYSAFNPPFALLQVVCAKVKYLLVAENCEERDTWLGHINKVLSGEPEPGVTCTCVA